MTLGIVIAFDATGSNYSHVPAGQRCGYSTGSGGVAWTPAMFAANPGCVVIDQSPVNTALDELADAVDFEGGAATLADLVPWVKAAEANFSRNARPGQRRPVVYCSASNVSAVVNALIAGGITSGVSLWIAHYGVTEAFAVATVLAAAGPFPVTGFQFTDTGGGGTYDIDVFSTAWLAAQSGVAGSTVAEGSSGPAVVSLQQRLTAWGGSVKVDGLFGSATLATLKSYQKAHQLAADGIAGLATWSALETSPVPSVPVSGPSGAPAVLVPAPLDLRESVQSIGAAATFSWGAVHGVTAYHVQAEYYKGGFGWVLSVDEVVSGTRHVTSLASRTKFRWRVSAATVDHVWSGWAEFVTA
jgi:peptidoglycan hydrolase-like protein with peptidoglycan-binding domain